MVECNRVGELEVLAMLRIADILAHRKRIIRIGYCDLNLSVVASF